MGRVPAHRWRRGGRAVAGAVAVHALVLAVVAWRWTAPDPDDRAVAAVVAAGSGAQESTAFVELVDDPVPGQPPLAVLGAGDSADFRGQHPLPNADVDMPGTAAAARGGGASGGTPSWTGRDDAHDIQSQIWSGPDRNLLPRQDTGASARSPEAIARVPEPAFDDRTERRRKARTGELDGRSGAAVGAETGASTGIEGDRWDEADPWFDAARARRDQRVDGTTRAVPATALVDRGDRATDTHRKGRTADDRSTIAASDVTDPLPFEMTTRRAGGTTGGTGVAGDSGAGVSARSPHRRGDTAGTRANVSRGPGRTSVRAARTDPYFRSMYERLDQHIEFPRELARRMEQGEVTVTFRLLADGRVADVVVASSSGFAAFDDQVTRAVRIAGPYGPVPAALLGGRSEIRVRAPYVFRNPMIR